MIVRSLLCGAVAAVAFSAAAYAASPVTGTVNVDGHVDAFCAVVGGTSASTFAGSIDLGALNDTTTGKLAAGLKGSTDLGTSVHAQVVCNSATPKIVTTATKITTAGAAPAGYSNTIDYVAHVTAAYAAGGTPFSETYSTASGVQTPVSGSLASPLLTGSNNITVGVNSLAAVNDGVLVVGTYQGVISITVTPS